MQVTTLSSLELPGWQVGLPDHNPGPTFQAVFSSTAADGSVALNYTLVAMAMVLVVLWCRIGNGTGVPGPEWQWYWWCGGSARPPY